jgi:hypothetical protein
MAGYDLASLGAASVTCRHVPPLRITLPTAMRPNEYFPYLYNGARLCQAKIVSDYGYPESGIATGTSGPRPGPDVLWSSSVAGMSKLQACAISTA